MKTPHSSWAEYYDKAYELSFGNIYKEFTDATIECIKNIIKPPSKIIDFGAGTGRLTIPLTKLGYQVTAVEPCQEMLNKLICKSNGLDINIINCKMEDYESVEKFEMALSVFTVILYIQDDYFLRKSFQAITDSLFQNGFLLLDIPSRSLFQNYCIENSLIKRQVTTTPSGNNLYIYNEDTTIFYENSTISYHDSFQIKYWEENYILNILSNNFIVEEKLCGFLNSSGSTYYLLRKK